MRNRSSKPQSMRDAPRELPQPAKEKFERMIADLILRALNEVKTNGFRMPKPSARRPLIEYVRPLASDLRASGYAKLSVWVTSETARYSMDSKSRDGREERVLTGLAGRFKQPVECIVAARRVLGVHFAGTVLYQHLLLADSEAQVDMDRAKALAETVEAVTKGDAPAWVV